jgi:glycerol-3-phosphate dehydrogenase
MSRISILGAGAWGTALAAAFSGQGHAVKRLWGRNGRFVRKSAGVIPIGPISMPGALA